MPFPKTITIQMTQERASEEGDYDSDSEDENSVPGVLFQQGRSREKIEINSWAEIAKIQEGYEPFLSEDDAEEYQMYLDSK